MTGDAGPTFVFHIGLERTGSTSFQRFCATHAECLRQSGILYPTRTLAFRVDNHGPLVASYLDARCGPRDFAIHARLAPKCAVLRSLFKEVAKQAPAIALISSEHFSSRFEADDIAALAQDFSDHTCKILVVVRPHRERFFSAYATSIMSGRHLTIEEYADEVLAPTNPYFRYRTLIERWERAFGRPAMIVRRYRHDGGLIGSLLDGIAARTVPIPAADGYTDNRSLGPACTEALRVANIALSRRFATASSQSYWSWLRKRYCEVRMKRWLVSASDSRTREAWHLSAAKLAALDALAAEDAAWLAQTYGIELTSPAPQTPTEAPQSAPDGTAILACALQDRILGQWNLVDAAMPALIPVMRVWHRWRMKGL